MTESAEDEFDKDGFPEALTMLLKITRNSRWKALDLSIGLIGLGLDCPS